MCRKQVRGAVMIKNMFYQISRFDIGINEKFDINITNKNNDV